MKFPPVKLWSRPLPRIDYEPAISDCNYAIAVVDDQIKKLSIERKKLTGWVAEYERKQREADFIYYLRSGRFPK